jgi:hypothetical protein
LSTPIRRTGLALIGLALAAALGSCGSGNKAATTTSGVALPKQTQMPDLGQLQSNWYKLPPAMIAEPDWGHVRASNGLLTFVLGPNPDRRRRHELGFGRVVFTSASITVADDERGKNLVLLEGRPAAGCLYHAQGDGINVIIAVRSCVPFWARTQQRTHARMWIRVQNLAPHPKLVFVKYDTMTA